VVTGLSPVVFNVLMSPGHVWYMRMSWRTFTFLHCLNYVSVIILSHPIDQNIRHEFSTNSLSEH